MEHVLSSIHSVTSIRPNTARVLARDLARLHWFPTGQATKTFAPGLNYRLTLGRAMFGLATDIAHAHAYSAAISGRWPATNCVYPFLVVGSRGVDRIGISNTPYPTAAQAGIPAPRTFRIFNSLTTSN